MTAPVRHPALEQLVRVARALGLLRDRVVFIGGAIAPLLQERPPFDRARPTSDVDAVVATASYAEFQRIEEELARSGFRLDTTGTGHLNRWRSPDGIGFDLVPAGKHPRASGNVWDEVAAETAVTLQLADGLEIRHASAPAFLALKWKAYHDRGQKPDPRLSHDLEDILALIASRPSLVDEVMAARDDLKTYLAQEAQRFLAHPDREDILAAHLNNAQSARETIDSVREALEAMATLPPN